MSTSPTSYKTTVIGNPKAAPEKGRFDDSSSASRVAYIGVRSDGDKIRGIKWRYFDGREVTVGGYDTRATHDELTLDADDTLASLRLTDSSYGGGSVRRIELTTSKGKKLVAGPGEFDGELTLPAAGAALCGFHGAVNSDNFLSSLGVWLSREWATPALEATAVKSDAIGNPMAGSAFADYSLSPITVIGVRWDGDKLRGIRWATADGTTTTRGDFDAGRYSAYELAPGETMDQLTLRSSSYGHGSVSKIDITTRNGNRFSAGPGTGDSELWVPVPGAQLVGFHGTVNSDRFLNALGVYVAPARHATPPVTAAVQSAQIGSPQAGKAFDEHSIATSIQFLAVRSDGDKIRGLFWQAFDGKHARYGDFTSASSRLDTYTFAAGETLTSLTLKDSGYGHGSVRRIELTTSVGGRFSAGPGGFDRERSCSVFGARLVGFCGAVNSDNFLNSLGVWTTPPSTSTLSGDQQRSRQGGDPSAGGTDFDRHSTSSPVRYLGVRFDTDKVRGIAWELFDGKREVVGDFDATSHSLASFTFTPGESLRTFTVKRSGYGYGSVRRIELTTSLGHRFAAGHEGFDAEANFSVHGSYLTGFHGKVNPDNYLKSLGVWSTEPVLPSIVPGTPQQPGQVGNQEAGTHPFDNHTLDSAVRYLAVRWDRDKVRGLFWEYFDGTRFRCGDLDSTTDAVSSYTFAPDELLTSLTLKDSRYGYGSVRRIELRTSNGGAFSAGPDGFDRETSFAVAGARLLGFVGKANSDNFINSLGPWISPPAGGALTVTTPVKSAYVGNLDAGATRFDGGSTTSAVRYLGVRWDRDKIRSMSWQLFDGSPAQTWGDHDAIDCALSSYTFAPDEFLTALTLKDSAYGHGSVRRIELRTSKGGALSAGPEGFDHALVVPAYGGVLTGFRGAVNVDRFMNALAAYVSAPVTMNGWDYVLGVDQALLNTLLPLVAQLQPVLHTPFGNLPLQRVWVESAAATGTLVLGVQVAGQLTIDGRQIPDAPSTIWRIYVTVDLASLALAFDVARDGKTVQLSLQLRDTRAFRDLTVEFAPPRTDWAALIAAPLKRALQSLAPGKYGLGSLPVPTLPEPLKNLTGWLPTYLELAWVDPPGAATRGGLALLVSTSTTPPTQDTRRAFGPGTLRAGQQLTLSCANGRLIRLVGDTVAALLGSEMGEQNRYPGNRPLAFTYKPSPDGGRTRASTDGNYCNFWGMQYTPSIDWCWIDALDDRLDVELRLRAVPYLDTALYITLKVTMTLSVDAAGKTVTPHLTVTTKTEAHVSREAIATIALVLAASAVIYPPLVAIIAGAIPAVMPFVDHFVDKGVAGLDASAAVSNAMTLDLSAIPLLDLRLNNLNISGTGDFVLGFGVKPWPLPPLKPERS